MDPQTLWKLRLEINKTFRLSFPNSHYGKINSSLISEKGEYYVRGTLLELSQKAKTTVRRKESPQNMDFFFFLNTENINFPSVFFFFLKKRTTFSSLKET